MTNAPTNKNLKKKIPLSILQRTSPCLYPPKVCSLKVQSYCLLTKYDDKTRSWRGETCSCRSGRLVWKVRWNPPNPLKVGKQIGWRGEVREMCWRCLFRFLAWENKDEKYIKHHTFEKESVNLGLISWFWIFFQKRLDDENTWVASI